MTLQEIGSRHGTDKATITDNEFTYLEIYETYLAPPRAQAKAVLEFGVLWGKSLLTWAEYFPQAKIIGVDADPACPDRVKHDRIEVITGNQTDKQLIEERLLPQGPFDLVVDDASHVPDDQVATFQLLWPAVARGGFYVVEDLGQGRFLSAEKYFGWPGTKYTSPSRLTPHREVFDFMLQRLMKEIDGRKGDLRALHYHSRICFFQKKAKT